MSNNQLVTTDQWSFDHQKDFLQTLIDSKQIPCKNVQEAFTVATYGRELGFSPISSFSYIINISGRLSLSVKAMKALLLRGGVSWKTIYDGAYVYSDGSVEEFKINKGEITPVDKISKIEFRRVVNGIEMVEYGSFTWQEAKQAGLVDTSKPSSAWNKYPQYGVIA